MVLHVEGTVLGKDADPRPLACLIEFGKCGRWMGNRFPCEHLQQSEAIVDGTMPVVKKACLPDEITEFRSLEAAR